MHGHQLRQLAEKEHIDLWTDITVGSLYGALKRLAHEGLIAEARTEREGGYPERQIWRITAAGRIALERLREDDLSVIAFKPDPFDLAMSRLDRNRLDELPAVIEARLAALRAMVLDDEVRLKAITQYLSVGEEFVMRHRGSRLRAEIAWHEELMTKLPAIIEDEKSRKETHK